MVRKPAFFQTMCYVSEGAIVVDTTSSVPGFRRITPPNDDPFPSRMYLFSDFEKVKSYWYDLKCVCLNTPLGKSWLTGIVLDTTRSISKLVAHKAGTCLQFL